MCWCAKSPVRKSMGSHCRWLRTSPSTIWIWIWPSWAAKSPGPCRRCRGCGPPGESLWGSGSGNQNLPRMARTFPTKSTPSQDPEQLITGLNLYLAQLPDAGDGGDTSLVSMVGHGFCGGPGADRCWGWVFLTDLSYGAIISRAISF